MEKWRVGIVGATGMVGQKFVSLLEAHPWFTVSALAASPKSAGKPYHEAVKGRWASCRPIPDSTADLTVYDAANVRGMAAVCDFIFCAVDMDKHETRNLEERYAKADIPVISNNSACRGLSDVPMIIPEVNAEHAAVIHTQRARLGVSNGFIAVKPNCSIQSYVPALTPLRPYGIRKVSACTYQAVSGAGKTLENWPEMNDNVIPYIPGEDEKSEREPLKIWGMVKNGVIEEARLPVISAQCVRVAVSDGHLAAVSVKFAHKPSAEDILKCWAAYETLPQTLHLPSAPNPFIQYLSEPSRPQTKQDRDFQRGMGISIGRLRPDALYDYKFICLSHNTVRGAAGGAILTAELLAAQGYISRKTR
jgi:aspartate-semialdehyde dehydrogenase